MTHAPTVVSALQHAATSEPSRPLLTYYDGETGERVELSVATFANWVHKIANLLDNELMLEPGEAMAVHLRPHWQSAVAIVGAWTAGLSVHLGRSSGSAAVEIVGPAALEHAEDHHGTVIACSLRPMGAAFTEALPDGWLDFAKEVSPQPDALLGTPHTDPEALALVGPESSLTHAGLAEAAEEAAIEPGLVNGGRLLTDANPAHPEHVLIALAAPILLAGSVVIVTRCDDTQRATIAAQERVTARLWVTG